MKAPPRRRAAASWGVLGIGRVGRDALEVGDHVRPLLRVADAGEGHAGAGRVGARLVQPLVQLLVGPGALLALDGGGVVEPFRMPVRGTDDAVEIRPHPALPTLVEGVAGGAEALG